MATTPIPVSELTSATIEGSGVFDILMRAMKAHLEDQHTAGRIKGAEYATVYLGSSKAVMDTALAFLLQQRKAALEAELLEKQIELAQKEIEKAVIELEILEKQKPKLDAEIAHLQAQTDLVEEQTRNAVKEGKVLEAQECKLRAEYDLIKQQTLKAMQETSLLSQKVATEKAQTQSAGVDADSVIGKQKALYGKQADGFDRDAEQKVAKILIDSWNVRRTTDEGTVADGNNGLLDTNIGRAVNKLLSGVNA